MRRRLAIPLVSLLSAAALVPLTGTAYAVTCATVGVPPHLEPGRHDIRASGTFHCFEESVGMRVTVCIQEQWTPTGEWFTRGCATTYAEGWTDSLTGEVGIPVMVYSTTLRTTVTARNDNGHTGTFTGTPTPWFNCACSVG